LSSPNLCKSGIHLTSSGPSGVLQRLIDAKDINSIRVALEDDFELMSQGPFDYLKDLVEAGYEICEIAELLVDVATDDPWVYITPQPVHDLRIVPDFHQTSCVHEIASKLGRGDVSESHSPADCPSAMECDEIKRQVAEKCGLAGVVPCLSYDMEHAGRPRTIRFCVCDASVHACVTSLVYSRYMGSVAMALLS
jgi:hypothetical protein